MPINFPNDVRSANGPREENKGMPRFVHVLVVSFLALFVGLPSISAAEPSNSVGKPDVFNIVALGDSLTVGYEKGMTDKSVPYGYADQIYEQALYHGRATLSNYAILGLTSSGLINLLQGAETGKKLAADDLQDFAGFPDPRTKQQAESVAAKSAEIAPALADADLVILTVGGNDFGGFIKSMVLESTETAKTILQNDFDGVMNNYTANVDTLMREIHKLAPNARIVLADQYLPLWEDHPLYESLLGAVDRLAGKLDELAAKLNRDGVPLSIAHVGDKFAHHVREYTYVKSILDFDNHPRQDGYAVMGEAFADVVWHDYLVPAPKPEGVTLSVIVNGQELAYKPINKKNTNFLPIRELAAAVGADFKWTQETKTAVFSTGNHQVVVTVDANEMIVDGAKTPLATPAYFQKIGKETKTYVPIAAIAKALDFEVVYRQSLQAAFINA